MTAAKLRAMPTIRQATALSLLVAICAGCGDRAGGTAPGATDRAPETAAVPATAAAAAGTAAPPAPPKPPAPPVDDRFAAEESGWRVAFALSLPELPESSARRVRRACEAWLFQGLVTPRSTFAASAAEAHRLLISDTPHTGAGEAWFAERSVVATHLAAGWLALARNDSSFAGGAHGNAKTEGLVVDLADVRALTLDEVVPPEHQPALRALLAQEFRRERQLPADGPLTSEIAADADLPIPLPILDATGARFVWNPYEIAPYSEGAFTVRLPADALRGLLARNPW